MSIEDVIPPEIPSEASAHGERVETVGELQEKVRRLQEKIMQLEALVNHQQAANADLQTRLQAGDMEMSGHLDMQPTPDEELQMFLREIAHFSRNNDSAGLEGLVQSYLARVRRRAEMEASVDALTGLPNKAVFYSVAEAFLKLAKNYNEYEERMREHPELEHRERKPVNHGDFSILMIDLDHFKEINDTYGHLAGDEVLRKVGELLRKESRENDEVARFGGEEFAVTYLNPHPNSRELFGEKLRSEIEALVVEFNGTRIPLTASIGGAMWHPGESLVDVISAADASLYQAKNAGRNRVVVDATR